MQRVPVQWGNVPEWIRQAAAAINGLISGQEAVPTLASGVYTPTLTTVANLASASPVQCQYLRVGSVVTVSGLVVMQATASGVSTQLNVSLPVASNFGSSADCGGVGFCAGVSGLGFGVYAQSTARTARFEFVPSVTTNNTYEFTFTYRII